MLGFLKNIFLRPESLRASRMASVMATHSGTRRVVLGRYDAAATTQENRRHWANADHLSANAANSPTVRRILRARSRYEVANNSYARGIVLTLANDCVGTGPRLQLLTDNDTTNRIVEQAFAQWAEAIRLAEKLRTMRMARAESGEVFGLLTANPLVDSPVKLDLRLIEADQIATPECFSFGGSSCHVPPRAGAIGGTGETGGGTGRGGDGIVFDAYGNPVEYHLLRSHPGDSSPWAIDAWLSGVDRIPASAMLHYFRGDRPGQSRGIPEITPALPLFAQLRRYTLAVIAAAETAADFAAVLYTDSPANGEADPVEPMDLVELEHRMATVLPGGWKLGQVAAEQPATTYGEFKHEILNEIARCLNMPFNIAAGNSSGYNYASGRLDHQTYYKSIRVDQSHMGRVVLDPLWRAWLDEAALIEGLLPPSMRQREGFPWHQWFWDGMEHVDPAKEANAQATRLASHTTTLAYEYARQGRDWEAELRQRAKEMALMNELGLPPEAPEPPEAAQTTPAAPAEPNSTDQENDDAPLLALPPLPLTHHAHAHGMPTEATPLTITASFQIEAAPSPGSENSTSGNASGGLPKFRMVAYTGGPMRVAGWRYPVVVDLAGLAIPTQNRPIRFGHDATSAGGVGHTDAIRVEAGQLIATGVVSRDTPVAKEIVTSSFRGFPWQASIGAAVEEFEFAPQGQTVIVNGRTFNGPVNVVRKATLGEISFVDLGADGNTSASINAAAADMTDRDQNKENLTMDASTSTNSPPSSLPSATSLVTPTTPAVQAAAVSAPVGVQAGTSQKSVDQLRAEALAETHRIAEIRCVCGGKHPGVEAKAIAEGWDPTKAELEVLRANRPVPPAMTEAPGMLVRSENVGITPQVLEAACYMSARLDGIEKMFDARTLEAADQRFHRAIGLQELLLEAAWANGYTGRSFRDSKTVMQYAFPPVNAAFSTIDIGGILSNVANKFLLEGFFSVERVWRNIGAVRNVSDFKTVTSYRLIGTDQYEQVSPGGQLKHGTLGNETYTNKADTYGLMLSIDRRDVINDDLGAITTVPRKLGRGSGLKINDIFWTIFLNNSGGAFFTTGNKNYLAGATTALGIDALSAAEQAFLDQVDSDGKPIGVMPAIMLVPTALSAFGTQLFKSVEIRDNTANAKMPIANPHQGKFRVEVSRYLGNAKYSGGSQKAWYLLSDPNDLPVIEVAFLNGNESPTIESAEADFNVLGVQMRGYHDFGVALQDPRGGIKSKGEA